MKSDSQNDKLWNRRCPLYPPNLLQNYFEGVARATLIQDQTKTSNLDSLHRPIGFDYCAIAMRQRVLQHIPPRKRTCAVQLGMSALGQKRTLTRLLDHFVRAGEQGWWNFRARYLSAIAIQIIIAIPSTPARADVSAQ